MIRRNQSNGNPKVINCASCGKIFQSVWNNKICPACREEIANNEEKVLEFLSNHDNTNLSEVSVQCGVSTTFIRRMIEHGKFVTQENSMTYPCHGCGAPISMGNYCSACVSSMKKEINEAKTRITENMKNPTAKRKRSGSLRSGVISDLAQQTRNRF